MELQDWLFVVSGTLGSLGALSIILLYIFAPSTRSESRQILLWLSIADLLQSTFFCVYLGDWLRDEQICLIHSVLGIVGAASSFLWTACLAYNVNYSVRYPGLPMSPWTLFFFHILCWGYPLASALAMVFLTEPEYTYPVYGGSLGWFACYLPSTFWTFVHFELPLFVCWIFTLVLYAQAKRSLSWSCERAPSRIGETTRWETVVQELRTKFVLVPLIFVFLRIWSFLDLSLWSWAHVESPWWLLYLRGVFDPLQGFCNAVVFTGGCPLRICFKGVAGVVLFWLP